MRTIRWAVSAGLVLGSAPLTQAFSQGVGEMRYDLPAQPLSKSVREVARQSGSNLIAPSDLLEGRTAPALRGRFEADAALDRLLAGSGLRVERSGDSYVIRRNEPGEAVAGGEPAAEQDTIVVTGTLVRGAQPTSPLITIGRDAIDRSGATSAERLLRDLPQNFGGGISQENFWVAGAGADITEQGEGVNLRGLGQRATLVLLNGRRLAPSGSGSFVDISLIPVSALERVEILTDGASAIYGSDAVGGVVNFILKRRFDGLETRAQIGTTTQGGGQQILAAATGGMKWAEGSAMLSYEFRRDHGILARDRRVTIGLDPNHSLLPDETRHSILGVVSQALTDRLDLEITGLHSRRDTDRSYFITGTSIPVEAGARARSTGVSGTLAWDLGRSWRAELFGQYFLSRTRHVQDQGILGLQSRFNTRNAMVETGLKIDGSLIDLPGGPVKLALGAQARHEAYRDLFETGSAVAGVRKDRRWARALFGELNLPIISASNRRPGMERLLVTAAGRYEQYTGLKASFDPKVGLLWSPVDGIAVRSSYDTSFRAPLLSETTGLYNAYYFPVALLYVDPGQAPPTGASLAILGSNPAIRPEQSRSWTLGAEWTPKAIPRFSATINYYNIRFSDRITQPTNQVVIVGNPALAPLVTLGPSVVLVTSILDRAGQVFDFSGPGFSNGGATPADVRVIVDARISNSAETVTSGLDLTLRYEFERAGFDLGVDANVNHVLAFRSRLTSASPAIELLDTPYQPLDWRAKGMVRWGRGAWSGSLGASYADGYRDNRTLDVRGIDAFTTIDASLTYAPTVGLLANTRISLFADNILDARPPRLLPDPGSTKGVGFDPVNATARGRSIALQLRRSW